MFERYTEPARRVIFFARYEAAQLGSDSIGTEHLLLGLIRENKGLPARLLRERNVSTRAIRAEIEGAAFQHEMVSTSVDIPLSAEARRVLGHADKEAETMLHEHIGPEHLLLGLLWVTEGVAAEILARNGLRLARVREDIVQLFGQAKAAGSGEDESAERRPKIGDIVHYHTKGERRLVTSPAIVTSVLIPEQGQVALTVFHVDKGPTIVPSAQPGPFATQPEDGCWTWPSE
jgi:ATP-dependent Clp protease ATP-binding subunit ClpA